MKINQLTRRVALLSMLMLTVTILSARMRADTGTCGGVGVTLPFTDVMGNFFFCQIAAAYFSGLTNGTTETTYTPGASVPREQMAAFVTRTLDQSLRRGSRRAAIKRFWDPRASDDVPRTTDPVAPNLVECDGTDVWVAGTSAVSRVRASDGRLLEKWGCCNTGFIAVAVLVARGRIYVAGQEGASCSLYAINPAEPPGALALVKDNLGAIPVAMTFDGNNIWIAHELTGLTRIAFGGFCSPCVSHFTTGFQVLRDVIYDGANIWVTDAGYGQIKKVNANGSVVSTVAVGDDPRRPVFDGTNIWVPNRSGDSVTVVRVKDTSGNPLSSPFPIATLTGNGLDSPWASAFDGERVLVTNDLSGSLSLWRAIDFAPLGYVTLGTGANPKSVCSDGLNFWIALGTGYLAKF